MKEGGREGGRKGGREGRMQTYRPIAADPIPQPHNVHMLLLSKMNQDPSPGSGQDAGTEGGD